MSFLDSSDSIFVDASLTDLGRERLARNDGSFVITRYRFADDEIDYTFWNALTGSDSKDRKILDTPVLEAFTNELTAFRYPLITVRNSRLQFLPSLVANPSSVTLKEQLDSVGGGVDVTFSQQIARAQTLLPAEMFDLAYDVDLDSDLLFVPGEPPVSISPYGTARYILAAQPGVTSSAGGSILKFTLRVQTLTQEAFDTLVGANVAKPRTINTTLTVSGQQSGPDCESSNKHRGICHIIKMNTCLNCKKETNNRYYCSRTCKKQGLKEFICPICAKTFKRAVSSIVSKVVCCSRKCAADHLRKRDKLICFQCGKIFSWVDSVKKYCSKECLLKIKFLTKKKNICKTCQKEFFGSKEHGGKFKGRSFCSFVCRNESYKKIPEPIKCLQCDKEFKVGGQEKRKKGSKFCSKDCFALSQSKKFLTQKFQKRSFWVSLKNDQKFCVRSRWEAAFIKDYLEKNNLSWEYEPKIFKTSVGNYVPDFYVKEHNCYYEIKGSWIPNIKKSLLKFQEFIKLGNNGILLQEKELKELYGLNLNHNYLKTIVVNKGIKE